MPRLDAVLAGREAAVSLPILGMDASDVVESVGEGALVEGGADVLLFRRCQSVLVLGDVAINGGAPGAFSECVDPPRVLGLANCPGK